MGVIRGKAPGSHNNYINAIKEEKNNEKNDGTCYGSYDGGIADSLLRRK